MIIGACGHLGSGKTLIINMLGYDFSVNTEYQILANFDTDYLDRKIDPFELMTRNRNISKSVLLLTEAHTFFDSRISGTKANRLQGYFYLQTRKRDCHVFYDSQILGAVDLRLRYVNDLEIVCASYPRLTRNKEYFVYTFYYAGAELPISTKRVYAKDVQPFFDMYDSYEVVSPFITEHVPFENVLDLYQDMPTKKSFITYLRSMYPALTIDLSQTIYDLLKSDQVKRAEQLLKMEFEYDQ